MIINERLWKKAYLFEFIDEHKTSEFFAFALPPGSEDFRFPQRVNETKTFGGSQFDDYGNDSIQIRLSGSTVNEERKIVLTGKTIPCPRYWGGEKEIFELQKLLKLYGNEKLKNKKVYLYDLSKLSLIQLTGATASNFWRVFVQDFSIKRGKEKPFTYDYNIDMMGVYEEKKSLFVLFDGDLNNALNKLQSALDVIETVVEVTESIADSIDTARNAIKECIDFFANMKDETAGKNTLKILGGISDTIRVLSNDNTLNLYNSAKKVVQSIINIEKTINNISTPTKKESLTELSNTFSVTFETNGGSSIIPQKVRYANKATKPTAPIKEKCAFENWYEDVELLTQYDFNDEITENKTLYAKYTQVFVTIVFVANGGSTTIPQTIPIGQKAIKPEINPTRNNYSFDSWYYDSDLSNQFDFGASIYTDIFIYAKWNVVYYVNFAPNGAEPIHRQIIPIGQKVIYPATPKKTDCLFVSWCADEALTIEYDFNNVIAENKTLYARWQQITNSVHFFTNGGSDVATEHITIGGTVTKPINPTKNGYGFYRWCKEANLENEFNFENGIITSKTTLYAAWTINTYVITFNVNGGSSVKKQTIKHNEKIIYPIIPIKLKNIFDKWCTDEALTTEYNFSDSVTDEFTLYAKWWAI